MTTGSPSRFRPLISAATGCGPEPTLCSPSENKSTKGRGCSARSAMLLQPLHVGLQPHQGKFQGGGDVGLPSAAVDRDLVRVDHADGRHVAQRVDHGLVVEADQEQLEVGAVRPSRPPRLALHEHFADSLRWRPGPSRPAMEPLLSAKTTTNCGRDCLACLAILMLLVLFTRPGIRVLLPDRNPFGPGPYRLAPCRPFHGRSKPWPARGRGGWPP